MFYLFLSVHILVSPGYHPTLPPASDESPTPGDYIDGQIEDFRYFVPYLMIIISETKDSPNKSREKVPQPFGRSRIS